MPQMPTTPQTPQPPAPHTPASPAPSAALLPGDLDHVFFAESLETFVSDIQRARPTVFFAVPRLWVKFQQGVQAKMPPEKMATKVWWSFG